MPDNPATVYGALRRAAEQWPDNVFLHVLAEAGEPARDCTYRELAERVETLRNLYREKGYGPGRRVAIAFDNRPGFFFHWFALNGVGVSVVPLNAGASDSELGYQLEHSESCLVVCLEQHAARLSRIVAGNSGQAPVICEPEDTPSAKTRPAAGEPDGDTECALLYTSGSTGKPKGCILSNGYYLLCGRWYIGLGGLCPVEPGRERLLTPLPLVHMNAMACSAMAMLMSGGCLIQLDRFHPRDWWRTVRDCRATIIHYLGVMPAMLLGLPEDEQDRRHNVKFGFGAGVNPRHHALFEERFGFPLIEAWAMTETGCAAGLIANQEPRKVGTSCIGRPTVSLDIRLVDEEGGDVAPGEPGELLVRGVGEDPRRGFFSAYLKDPEATAAAWEGGYLHTGDVVRCAEDGQYHFVDRRKNVIRRSGENISALEVEAALSTHPAVGQVAVAPVADEIRGDEVMAVIVADEQARANVETVESIFRHCLDQLAYFKAPGYIAFVEALPLTASQKPRRDALRRLCSELVENGDCLDLRGLKKRPRESGAA